MKQEKILYFQKKLQEMYVGNNPILSTNGAGSESDLPSLEHLLHQELSHHANTNRFTGDVYDALNRIEAGNYGICLDCRRKIPQKRLEALPATKYCIKCQEENSD